MTVLGAVGDEADRLSCSLRPNFRAFLYLRTCLSSGSLHRDQSDVQAGVVAAAIHRLAQDFPKQVAGHGDLRHLQSDVPAVRGDICSDLDELLSEAG